VGNGEEKRKDKPVLGIKSHFPLNVTPFAELFFPNFNLTK
jgi:hypothetical protein